jgi:hypothetical protein
MDFAVWVSWMELLVFEDFFFFFLFFFFFFFFSFFLLGAFHV